MLNLQHGDKDRSDKSQSSAQVYRRTNHKAMQVGVIPDETL